MECRTPSSFNEDLSSLKGTPEENQKEPLTLFSCAQLQQKIYDNFNQIKKHELVGLKSQIDINEIGGSIMIVGSQNAGKSMVTSRLTGVSFPSSANRNTR
jgi:hypothetical protein